MQICSLPWLAELRIAAGSLVSRSCALACVSAADKRLYSLFFPALIVRMKSTGELRRRVVFSQPVLNPILFASLQGGIWMTWSISNQERPEAFSLAIMEFPNKSSIWRAHSGIVQSKGQVACFHGFIFFFIFFLSMYLSPWVGMMADNLQRGSAVR